MSDPEVPDSPDTSNPEVPEPEVPDTSDTTEPEVPDSTDTSEIPRTPGTIPNPSPEPNELNDPTFNSKNNKKYSVLSIIVSVIIIIIVFAVFYFEISDYFRFIKGNEPKYPWTSAYRRHRKLKQLKVLAENGLLN